MSELKPGYRCCKKNKRLWCFFIVLLLCPLTGFAQDKPEKSIKPQKQFRFEGSAIEGEREKPKDLYILTWKESRPLEATPMNLEFLNTYQSVHDRYQFEREMEYTNKMK